jgi:hypothetical protein
MEESAYAKGEMLEGREFAEDADERLVGQLEVARHICFAIREQKRERVRKQC